MKHDLKVTLFLILLFFSAQIVGMFLLYKSISTIQVNEQGKIEVNYTEPITGRPDIKGQDSFTYTLFMIFGGTVILLLLIRFKLYRVWKIWFFLAVFGSLAIAFSVVLPVLYSVILAFILTYMKLFRPNLVVHNITEIFIYGGITIMISPIFTVFWCFILLIAISIYDAFAVWKLKHMITLATAQAENKMFAGLLIPYETGKKQKEIMPKPAKSKKAKAISSAAAIKMDIPEGFKDDVKSAILGGGDIAFPMIFAGSVLTSLIEKGITPPIALLLSLIVPLFAGIALFILLLKSKKDTFYPAMPFITAGCVIGYIIVLIIQMISF